jgi:SAM-dependent methyltransferase
MSESSSFPEHSKLERATQTFRLFEAVLADLGSPLHKEDTILDFGCGDGLVVYVMQDTGYSAFGVDIAPHFSDALDLLCRKEMVERTAAPFRLIDPGTASHLLPFEDETFDLVISYAVLEHVRDYPPVFQELKRVMKPNARSLHIFPSRYRPIEPHLFVPFGTIFQGHAYLYFWAVMGIRNQFQKGLDAAEVAKRNFEYLKSGTNYMGKKALVHNITSYFDDVAFVETSVMKHSHGRLGLVYRILKRMGLTKALPVVSRVVSTFGSRAVFCVKTTDGRSQ